MSVIVFSRHRADQLRSLARLMLGEGDLDAATYAIRGAIASDARAEDWACLGYCLQQRARDLEEALAAYRQASALGLDTVQFWANYAEACIDTLRYTEAEHACVRALALDPEGAHPASMRVRALVLKAAHDLA